MTYQCVQVNGIDLYYQDVGEGPPVVFVHGFSGNHLSWWQQIPAFADRYRCLAPDQRLFGRSTDEPDGPGATAHADDLIGLLDHLEVEEVALVGHSMGGWPVAAFGSQYPERTAALVLSGTPGGLLSADRHAELLDAGQASLPDVDPLSREDAFLSDAIEALNTDRPDEFASIRPTLEAFSIDPDRLVEGDVPTFLIAGEADQFMPRNALEALAARLEGAEYAIVDEAGHSANVEQPAAFNQYVGAFLDEHVIV
ncbi:alpha/beta hydrolase [Salinadaptatus halalkaliphilus]|uniref:Alpha/beta hydrolase n=1 Tax=Salinadaptatus halalkaliphilus TaxID=2419781 RepID=A0A4S3TL82_9EURY|nr:alpha/beta hydrolase [Salinadaptatus halalkaliphilus]THE63358.1 alpha/beta hydrolase [Salinadaptatus halalkaliphilus]